MPGVADMSGEHGGQLHRAAARYGIPVTDWLDLSTGISPWSWPVPSLPETVWQRLPDEEDGLVASCREALSLSPEAGCLPVAGSQAALQTLPSLRRPCRVGVPVPGYREHALAWQRQGHTVVPLAPDTIEDALQGLDVLVWLQPNNPTGLWLPLERLLAWQEQLAARGGWLVVDEAFVEASAAPSLVGEVGRPGLIVFRSLGKFYGLAGARAGLMLAEPALCDAVQMSLGPWALSHPARHIMARALLDRHWQAQQQARLRLARVALDRVLIDAGFEPAGGCDLFAWCPEAKAGVWAERLARQGILVRAFDTPSALRFGLPGDEAARARLCKALAR